MHYETLHAVHIAPFSRPLPDGRMWQAERDAQPSGGGGQHRGQPVRLGPHRAAGDGHAPDAALGPHVPRAAARQGHEQGLGALHRLSEHALKEDSIASQVSCALQENRTLVFWNEDSTLQGEDKYLRLDYVKGHLQSGILCATSDEIEEAREGYPCGFFALPLSHIKNHGDTIYFSIVMPRGENFYRARPFRISPESGLIKPDSDELWENEDDWEHNYIPYLVKYGCQDTISIRYKMYMKGDSLLLYNILLGNNYGSSGHITFKKMNPLSQSQ